jgi:hypothetical protein
MRILVRASVMRFVLSYGLVSRGSQYFLDAAGEIDERQNAG